MQTETTWPIFDSALRIRRQVAEGTMAFEFEKPPHWDFTAGQFVDITLANPPETDAEGNKRGFSISSAPYEDTIMVTTRMRDTAFKRVLKTMPLGTEVKIEGAFGELILHEDASRPAILLTGGVGITTFRSIVFQAAHLKLAHHIVLFYSNRRPEDAPFLAELQALQKVNPNYTLVATMTGMEKSVQPWSGETGMIDARMLAKYSGDTRNGIFYITGPPAMVRGLQTMLAGIGVRKEDVRVEEYTGY